MSWRGAPRWSTDQVRAAVTQLLSDPFEDLPELAEPSLYALGTDVEPIAG